MDEKRVNSEVPSRFYVEIQDGAEGTCTPNSSRQKKTPLRQVRRKRGENYAVGGLENRLHTQLEFAGIESRRNLACVFSAVHGGVDGVELSMVPNVERFRS